VLHLGGQCGGALQSGAEEAGMDGYIHQEGGRTQAGMARITIAAQHTWIVAGE